MMKKILCFAIAMMMILAGLTAVSAETASATDDSAAPDGSAEVEVLTARELADWTEGLKALALESELTNDPSEEAAETEDGTLFEYSFATLYADGTEMTGDTRIHAVEIAEAEEIMPRGLRISMVPAEAAALFPSDNPDMAGDRTGAVLYMRETGNNSLAYGRVYRDRQRISALEYGEIVPDGDGFRVASLTCRFAEGLLYNLRAEGVSENPAAVLNAEDREAFIAELKELDQRDEYVAVASSRNGLELTAFGASDLVFSGIDFLNVKPDDLPGNTARDLFDNEDGTWIMTVTGEDYEAVFRCDQDGGNAKIVSFTITGEEIEGPRGVRLGDMFHEDMQRFRFEGRGVDEKGIGEVLYGEADQVPRGTVTYVGDDGITLQYVTDLPDGGTAELLLRYTFSTLSEIILMAAEN